MPQLPYGPSTPHHPRAQPVKPVPQDEVAEVTVVLRPEDPEGLDRQIESMYGQHPAEREYLDESACSEQCRAHEDHVQAVADFARSHGLEVAYADRESRSVVVRGPLGKLAEVFRVELMHYEGEYGGYRSHEGAAALPDHLHEMVEAVLGLDTRRVLPRVAATETGAFTPDDLARAYDFPEADGSGQTIVIHVPGGGVVESDWKAFFANIGKAMPRFEVQEVAGHTEAAAPASEIELVKGIFTGKQTLTRDNLPSFASGLFTVEAAMDTQLVGALAPKARIVLLLAPGDAQGRFRALTAALAQNPSVISCSWSSHEDQVADQDIRVLETLFKTAALRGVTVCFSSGDDGDGTLFGRPKGVHWPSSSPNVLACGGTTLTRSDETAWFELAGKTRLGSGGGFSLKFPKPQWQSVIQGTGRGVPDVAAKADLAGGINYVVQGIDILLGGTSQAAPMWASLIARINQLTGKRAGLVGPLFYTPKFRAGFRDIVSGNNGSFNAGPGWDACTGWGSPKGRALLKLLGPS